jgi:hypothetical protein
VPADSHSGSFCTGSAARRECFHYFDKSSEKRAHALVNKATSRGEPVQSCTKLSKRSKNKEVCYVAWHKQPTNFTLLVSAGFAAFLYSKVKSGT